MTAPSEGPAMLVPLREATVARLMALRAAPDESIDCVVERISQTKRVETAGDPDGEIEARRTPKPESKYVCDVLGERLRSTTLPLLFSEVVDLFDYLAPEALDRLETERVRTRRHVSRNRADIHPGRSDLAVMKTRSGWWISRNVGVKDVARALEALCLAAALEFGRDVRLLVTRRVDGGGDGSASSAFLTGP